MNSVNIHSRDDIENEFIHKVLHGDTHNRNNNNSNLPTLLVIHCEFSSHRGPLLASHLRNCDRIINQDHYPKLFYPDILILDGGYKAVLITSLIMLSMPVRWDEFTGKSAEL